MSATTRVLKVAMGTLRTFGQHSLSLLVDRPPKVPGRIAAEAASPQKNKGMVLNGATPDKPERTVCNGAVALLQQAAVPDRKAQPRQSLMGAPTRVLQGENDLTRFPALPRPYRLYAAPDNARP